MAELHKYSCRSSPPNSPAVLHRGRDTFMLVCLASTNRRGRAGSTPSCKNGADQNQDKEHDLQHTALNRSRFQDAASNDLRGVPSDIIEYCNHGLRESKIRILCSKVKNYFEKKLHNYHKNNNNNNNKNRQLNFKKKTNVVIVGSSQDNNRSKNKK